MDKNISLRKAEIGDIQPIKAILFNSLKEYEIAIPDNYSVSDIDSIDADPYLTTRHPDGKAGTRLW